MLGGPSGGSRYPWGTLGVLQYRPVRIGDVQAGQRRPWRRLVVDRQTGYTRGCSRARERSPITHAWRIPLVRGALASSARVEPGSRCRAEEQPEVSPHVAATSMKQLLEAGVHFGHQTRRWNPKMREYIFAERNGIHIIDLAQTVSRLDAALEFIRETVRRGDSILFVGTKKQAQEALAEA